MTTPAVEVVWVAQETEVASGFGSGCAPRVVPERRLPAGLRGRARSSGECGPDWVFVDFEPPGALTTRPYGWYVPAKALVKSPPKVAWDKAPAGDSAFIQQAGDRPSPGVFVDAPTYEPPALLSEGQVVSRLSADVVRTAEGREVWLDPFYVSAEDPLAKSASTSQIAAATLHRRFASGRVGQESGAPLAPLPDTLGKGDEGRVFVFQVDPRWLDQPRYDAAWFDPVGHTLTHPCGDKRVFLEPCGTFTLEYSALGAWLPERPVSVVARYEKGTLRVLVLDPFGDRIGVSPEWDGAR